MTGARHSMYGTKVVQLPSGFTPVAWLDCDTKNLASRNSYGWGAYAKTDITGLTRDSWRLDAYAVRKGLVGEWNFLAGAESVDNENGYIKIRLYSNTGLFEQNVSSSLTVPCDLGVVQHVVIKNSVGNINGVSWSIASSSVTNTRSLCIGGAQLVTARRDGYKRTWPGLIGRVKVHSGGTLVGDFRPARRLSDGIYGFYCMVSKKFYPSANPKVAFKEGVL